MGGHTEFREGAEVGVMRAGGWWWLGRGLGVFAFAGLLAACGADGDGAGVQVTGGEEGSEWEPPDGSAGDSGAGDAQSEPGADAGGGGASDAAAGADGAGVTDAGTPDADMDGGPALDGGADGGPDVAMDVAMDVAEDAAELDAGEGGGDAEPDAPVEDIAEPDALPEPDAEPEPDAGTEPLACGTCPWNQQPAPPHPGSAEKLFSVGVEEKASYGPSGASVVLFRPSGPGPFPLLGFVHGKQLFEGGFNPLDPVPGYAYRDLLQHVASKGYLVLFVRVEQGLLDADHARMADDFLDAVQHALDTEPTVDPQAVAYAGHSMGAKVSLIAAGKATALDPGDAYADPTALYLMAYENSPPPVGDYVDARTFVEDWQDEPVWVSFLDAADDSIAPWNGANPNSKKTYDVLGAAHKQIVLLHGSGFGDPNPITVPELHDDHAAPMSISGKNGGLSDFAMPTSYLDALDWYGYWKILVGGLDYHFYEGPIDWAYGALRTHGGVLPNGTIITHEVAAESL